MVKVVRAMEEDQVQPNGATYYYLVNGMANVDHGYNYDFKINHRLEKLQHWRVALEALEACEANGFDTTDTMHNSAIVACTIPGINQWRAATGALHKLLAEDRKLHPNMVKFFHDCLVRNYRPREASALLRLAAQQRVKGYEHAWEPDVYKGRPHDSEIEAQLQALYATPEGEAAAAAEPVTDAPADADAAKAQKQAAAALLALHLRGDQEVPPDLLLLEMEKQSQRQMAKQRAMPQPFTAGLHSSEINSAFRPRVYRQLWYKWHQIANRYRPTASLKRRQLAPKDSPTGIPAWGRI
ncbi:hypothetical protein STCU_09671 [Strigomonas culicis]|uniref:Uncharacterized protein n=1 Tax=Strigomonas culicis TaxID=28005 RepID=S9UWW9_9TRYP|nr:hypothetical protein STCU_09671 [Strigomonas culicis]|eukprot:EPY19006.1 hypothetical protein STCU_09671 [Strigomonas culicis]